MEKSIEGKFIIISLNFVRSGWYTVVYHNKKSCVFLSRRWRKLILSSESIVVKTRWTVRCFNNSFDKKLKNPVFIMITGFLKVVPHRLELWTHRLWVCCSNQLSYRTGLHLSNVLVGKNSNFFLSTKEISESIFDFVQMKASLGSASSFFACLQHYHLGKWCFPGHIQQNS